jgi:hypothetical protein
MAQTTHCALMHMLEWIECSIMQWQNYRAILWQLKLAARHKKRLEICQRMFTTEFKTQGMSICFFMSGSL